MQKNSKTDPAVRRLPGRIATLIIGGTLAVGMGAGSAWPTDTGDVVDRLSLYDPLIEPVGTVDDLDASGSTLNSEDQAEVDQALTAARRAIIARDYAAAVRLLTKVLSFPENKGSAEAQELLGVVRERNGQFAHAKAEYKTYLDKYPQNEGAVRVRQRLAAILTAEAAPPEPLREPSGKLLAISGDVEGDDPRMTNFEEIRVERPSPRLVFRSPALDAEADTEVADEYPIIESWGSIGATYFFNQGTTVLTEFETNRETKDDFIFENSLVTSLEYQRSYEDQNRKLTFRVSGSSEVDFVEGFSHDLHISRLYGEIEHKETGLTIRFGRQTLYSAGVFGRFDGVRLSWQVNDRTSVTVAPRSAWRAGGTIELLVLLALSGAALFWGWQQRGEGNLTAETGIGYVLGIVGASMMLALLLYPLRKRLPGLRVIGSVRGWFRVHMILGLTGPVLIVLHSNYKLGSLNSSIALVSMLIVALSGLIGRFLYARIHRGLYGRRANVREYLGAVAASKAAIEPRSGQSSGPMELLQDYEDRRLAPTPKIGKALIRVASSPIVQSRLRRRALRMARQMPGARRKDIRQFRHDLDAYLVAAARTEAFSLYERLFALWHLLHLPLFIILVLAALAHVVAVHMY